MNNHLNIFLVENNPADARLECEILNQARAAGRKLEIAGMAPS